MKSVEKKIVIRCNPDTHKNFKRVSADFKDYEDTAINLSLLYEELRPVLKEFNDIKIAIEHLRKLHEDYRKQARSGQKAY